MSDHLLVVTGDIEDDTLDWRIFCVTPERCNGWQECGEDHEGFDPTDETSAVYDDYDDIEIHGELHDWNSHGWVVAYEGCVVNGSEVEPFWDIPMRAGVWVVDDDWDDTDCTIIPVREVSQEELQMKRYKNGKTVFDADDMAALSPDRDRTKPLTEGQRAFLEAIVNTASASEPASDAASGQETGGLADGDSTATVSP